MHSKKTCSMPQRSLKKVKFNALLLHKRNKLYFSIYPFISKIAFVTMFVFFSVISYAIITLVIVKVR